MDNMEYIKQETTRLGKLLLANEEATELALAFAKLIRAEGYGTPTPIGTIEALANVYEEIADLLNALTALELCLTKRERQLIETIRREKLARWVTRTRDDTGPVEPVG